MGLNDINQKIKREKMVGIVVFKGFFLFYFLLENEEMNNNNNTIKGSC